KVFHCVSSSRRGRRLDVFSGPDVDLWKSLGEKGPRVELDETFMREALRLALKARAADEVPVGAVIVRDGKIISRAYNQVELLKDATAHAEMLALTAAEAAVSDWRLTDCDLYVTKEPCPMCAGAIVHTRSEERRVGKECRSQSATECER